MPNRTIPIPGGLHFIEEAAADALVYGSGTVVINQSTTARVGMIENLLDADLIDPQQATTLLDNSFSNAVVLGVEHGVTYDPVPRHDTDAGQYSNVYAVDNRTVYSYEEVRTLEIKELHAKVRELEEKLKATVSFYEGMVDEELGGANDDSSGS